MLKNMRMLKWIICNLFNYFLVIFFYEVLEVIVFFKVLRNELNWFYF